MMVQKLRVQNGWSQEQLADLSGVSVRTIQRIECGQSASVESLKALGAAFDVDFSSLKEPDMTPTASAAITNDEALALAHVRRIKGFYLHVAQYGVVVAALAIANMVFASKYPWVLWVAGGWGIGLIFHGLRAFDRIPFLNGDWERRQVEKQLGRKL